VISLKDVLDVTKFDKGVNVHVKCILCKKDLDKQSKVMQLACLRPQARQDDVQIWTYDSFGVDKFGFRIATTSVQMAGRMPPIKTVLFHVECFEANAGPDFLFE